MYKEKKSTISYDLCKIVRDRHWTKTNEKFCTSDKREKQSGKMKPHASQQMARVKGEHGECNLE